ncbi:ashwin isoform X2 [Clupea harengus]|uniref:Ashwin n=1 Tax=Clupea harengus TaxID=7950 RepID=A0A6P3VLJ6_CLUHA|nr:ashwin isoform X2 [Clupea harengus]
MHKMANHRHGRDGKEKNTDGGSSVADLLLHPELLSNDFIKLILHERNIQVDSDGNQDQLTDLYMRHVIPLPQRELPNSRWGKKMQKTRVGQSSYSHSSTRDLGRKRPLIVFDSSSTGSGKLKKPDTSPGVTDRLKPPPSMNLTNPIRKLPGSSSNSSSSSSSSSSTTSTTTPTTTPQSPSGLPLSGLSNSATAKLKRPGESDCSGELMSPDVKKKIQHVSWP